MVEYSPIITACRWHEPRFQEQSSDVVTLGRNLFWFTNLVLPGEIGEREITAVLEFLHTAEPDPAAHPDLANYAKPGGLKEHSRFAMSVAFKLAQAINSKLGPTVDEYAQAAALGLHDLGRFGSHSFMETDVLTEIYWKEIGLRQDIHNLTHSAHLYWDDEEIPFKDLTVPFRISIISDISSKRSNNDPNRLRVAEELLPSIQQGKLKYLTKPNKTPYERELVKRLDHYTRKENYLVQSTVDWFNSLGIDLNEILLSIPCDQKL